MENPEHARGSIDSLLSRGRSLNSYNLISEDFIAGYMHDGRMSVVRRFFCLFITFDLVFISLLWIITVMITGDNISHAINTQVVHYTVKTSLFDIVLAALCRFTVLILFYGFLYINHWVVIALTTSGSCAFLVAKVFVYNWLATPEPVFEVVLVLISFVLAWGEAWFLDCRVIPQEKYAQNYYIAISNANLDRASMMAPFLNAAASQSVRQSYPESSAGNFYSPFESIHNSDEDEVLDETEVLKKKAFECVQESYDILEKSEWVISKTTSSDDTIQYFKHPTKGKIYRLTGKVNYPAKKLLRDLFYNIEDVPKWNPTLLESKIVRKIDSHTDISYQATIGGGGGLIKPRDFVNLRCWRLCKNGEIVNNFDLNGKLKKLTTPKVELSKEKKTKKETQKTRKIQKILEKAKKKSNSKSKSNNSDSESSSDTDEDFYSDPEVVKKLKELQDRIVNDPNYKKEDVIRITQSYSDTTHPNISNAKSTLSKSLGAKDFSLQHDSEVEKEKEEESNDDDDDDDDYNDSLPDASNIFISAAVSIEDDSVPAVSKYVRGENVVSCWAMREINNDPNSCIFEWLLCIDLKGLIPKYILDSAYTTLMEDYMKFLRSYVNSMNTKLSASKTQLNE